MDAYHKAIPSVAPLIRWLHCVAILIVIIVAVGGITRLTESGLSITEWKPVTGIVPPMSEAGWQAEFAAYKQIPQYTEVNGPAGMTLDDYKFIYFWEWFHRLIARVIGLAFALPLAWFWIRKQIPAGFKPRLLALLALGALQGTIGWWMVASGLSAEALARVSHFRLAAHLLTALFTLGGLIWTARDLHLHGQGRANARLTPFALVILASLFLQLLLGAFTAGLRAGYIANDWPLMQGQFIPAGIDWSKGMIITLLNDPFLIYFLHRWWAFVVVAMLIVLARKVKSRGDRVSSIAIHTTFGLQIVLGIATVMSGVALWLAVMHQLVGALLVIACVWGVHSLGTWSTEERA